MFDYGGRVTVIPPSCQMIERACATTVGTNQVTQLIAPSLNPNGLVLYTLYTQVIQANNPNTNIAQTLIVASLTAPVNFTSKVNCLPIFRTYQDGSQTPISLGGGTPTNIMNMQIPPGWGLWQLCNVTQTALVRNNVRMGVLFL